MRGHGLSLVLVLVLVVLIGSSKTKGQSSALTSVFPPETFPTEAPNVIVDTRWTHSGVDKDETSPQNTEGTVWSWETTTVPVLGSHRTNTHPSDATSHQTSSLAGMSPQSRDAVSDSVDGLSSIPSLWNTAFSSPASVSANGRRDFPIVSSTTPTHWAKVTSTFPTQLQSRTQSPDQPPAKAETSELEVPPELAVGDDDVKGRSRRSSSPLDALLAGLLSVFIVATAVVFLVLFLRFRQKTNHPEFHRLHDLPMDDLMEDTPLSRYSY